MVITDTVLELINQPLVYVTSLAVILVLCQEVVALDDRRIDGADVSSWRFDLFGTLQSHQLRTYGVQGHLVAGRGKSVGEL